MKVSYETLDGAVYVEKGFKTVKIVKPFLVMDNRIVNLYDLRIKHIKVDNEIIYLLSVEDFTDNIEEEE